MGGGKERGRGLPSKGKERESRGKFNLSGFGAIIEERHLKFVNRMICYEK